MAGKNYHEFFDPLVGTPQAAAEFRTALVSVVDDSSDPTLPIDPYDRLAYGLENIIDDFANSQLLSSRGTSFAISEAAHWARIAKNIKVGGVRLTVDVLRAVGNQYRKRATVPQEEAGVKASVRTALGYVLGLAMTDATTATINVNAARRGFNPRSRFFRPLYRFWGFQNKFGNMEKIFTVTPDPTGQLSFAVRHRPAGALTDARCPATYARTETGNGHSEASLWRYLQTIGDAALSIYPRQFDIIPETLASGPVPEVFEPLGTGES